MTSALLSDFDRLTPTQRATVEHWIIDDLDRLEVPLCPYDFDILTERREGWTYDYPIR